MGIQSGASIDAWLRAGELVVASTDRAARAIQADFHRRRRAEGVSAWPSPKVVEWNTFVRTSWEERNSEGRLLLNRAQELAVWSGIIESGQELPTTLPPSIRRLAMMAMEAHDLICSYAPRLLEEAARTAWDRDAGAFSGWLAEFDRKCRKNGFVSQSRVALDLIHMLHGDKASRPSLRLAGFDRILPVQRELLDRWGEWKLQETETARADIQFHSLPDSQTELESCAWRCHRQIEANPGVRLLVITQDQAQRRGEIERAFLRFSTPGESPRFEFSLGIPLAQIAFVRSALLLLRWLQSSLAETEVDWLFASHFGSTAEDSEALQSCMRALRRRDLQRPQWELESFLNQPKIASTLPRDWARGLIASQRMLKEAAKARSPVEWTDMIPRLLETAGWQGSTPQTSADFQAQRRWTQALDTAGSLGFDGRRVSWSDLLAELHHATEDILFAPQSVDAPIQIAGPAESAGLTADAIWFLGADEESWPAMASAHPFLPLAVQRQFNMPHSSAQADWDFSATVTDRLLASAPLVHFSVAALKEEVETRPSRLVSHIAGPPRRVPDELLPPKYEQPTTTLYEDFSTAPYPPGRVQGGSAILSYQSQCPFKAFATARLGAQSWDAAESGLSARQRGQLLHDALHSIWSGHKPGIKTHQDLDAIGDLPAFVRKHVKAVMQSGVPEHIRESMPDPYIELEETRLIRLLTDWLNFEKARVPFTVEATEAKSSVIVEGLTMDLRLDRVDRLRDGSQLVIDYKTGTVDPKAWDMPRPEDVQLPLYKLFGLAPLQASLFDSFGGPARGGLVFARVRTGETCFAGRVADARETIQPGLSGNSSLVRRRLTAAEESDWKAYIETLAHDFLHGRAEVNPRDYPDTCKRCGLQSVCRIQEPENCAHFELEELESLDANEN